MKKKKKMTELDIIMHQQINAIYSLAHRFKYKLACTQTSSTDQGKQNKQKKNDSGTVSNPND